MKTNLESCKHPYVSRRQLIQAGSVGILGMGMNHLQALRAAGGEGTAPSGTARSVIFIFLSGGLTQHDSFDMKPSAPADIRGEFKPIATRTPGLQICEHLPGLAQRSEQWSVVRSLGTPYNGHSEGHMALQSGRTPLPQGFNGSKPQDTDWPSIASVVGDALPPRNNNLPPAVVLPERLVHRTGRVIPGQFGGQMGHRRDPWFIGASPFNAKSYGAYPDYEFHFRRGREKNPELKFEAPNLSLPEGINRNRLTNRAQLRSLLDSQRASLESAAAVESFDNNRQAAISLLTEPRVQRAFDVHSVDDKVQHRYGKNAFGWSLLMARQLVEAGVNLVQVNLGNNESWDTHDNNFPLLKDCLFPPTDQALSALLDDLGERGLLDDTLIVMCGEMGRTPKINKTLPGRDHWGAVQSVLMAGGGVPGGCVVGSSDKDGAYPASDPQRPENMAATIYGALGIPQTAVWKDEANRPYHIYHDRPIQFS